MAKKCARTFSIVVEKGKKSILDVGHLLPDALPRSVRERVESSVDPRCLFCPPGQMRGIPKASAQSAAGKRRRKRGPGS